MKHKSKDDFIKSCNDDKGFVSLLGRNINETDLKRFNIVPNALGEYIDAQKFELYSRIRVDEGYEYFDKEALIKILSLQPEIEKYIEVGTVQKLLLLYLSPKFRNDLKQFRKNSKIPEAGFGPKDVSLCVQWFNGQKDQIGKYREKCVRYTDKLKKFDLSKAKEKNWYCNHYASMFRIHLDVLLFKHYGSNLPNYKFENSEFQFHKIKDFDYLDLDAPPTTFFSEVSNFFKKQGFTIADLQSLSNWTLESIAIFDLWKPFVTPPLYYYYQYYNNYYKGYPFISWDTDDLEKIRIEISGPTDKRNLIEYINKNWRDIKQALRFISKSPPRNKSLIRDYLVVQLNQQGKTAKEIKNIIKKEAKRELNINQIRQILKRTKEKVKRVEMLQKK